MKKISTFLSILLLSAVALFAQTEIPSGYESIYDAVGETALVPDTADAQSTLKLLGPTANWNSDIYDFTDYRYIDVKLRFHQADTTKQVALRYYAGGAINVDLIDLPGGEDTTYVIRLNLPDYAVADDSVIFGGIWLYNGASHWSFSYTGEPATEPVIVEYVAIKKKTKIPDGWVSLYSIKPNDYEKAPYVIDSQSTYQLSGPGANWDKIVSYDITNYDTLAIKLTYHKADIGKEVAVRFAANASGVVNKLMVTLPDVPDTTHIIKIGIADYTDDNGQFGLGGLLLYNGSSHWSITYTDPATLPTTIDYVALKTIPVQGIAVAAEDTTQSQNISFGLSTQLRAVFTPVNATNQSVLWSSADTTMATVDNNGLVTAKQVPGDVVITATSVEDNSFTATYSVKITGSQVNVTGISISEDTVNIKINFEGTAEYTISPADASLKTVNWMSTDTTVAKVDEKGIITSIHEGYAKLIATTEDGGFKDSCIINIVGYKDIPRGYASLYTLEYVDDTVSYRLDTISGTPGADVPGLFNTKKNDANASLLGPTWGWNDAAKYTDLSLFTQVEIAASFRKEDVGKDFLLRYAFSGNDTSVIVNRTVTVEKEDMLIVIDLNSDTADIDGLKRLGALKLAEANSGALDVVIDYVAVKKASLSSEARLSGIKLNNIGLYGFESDTYTYTLNIQTSSLTVTATPMDENASVQITNDGIIDLSNGSVTVTITVTAEDGTTKEYTLNLSGTTGVDDNLMSNEMKVYPTLSTGSFKVEFKQMPGKITVFNITGNVVMQKEAHNLVEEINLTTGLYFIKLECKGVSKIVKVISTNR